MAALTFLFLLLLAGVGFTQQSLSGVLTDLNTLLQGTNHAVDTTVHNTTSLPSISMTDNTSITLPASNTESTTIALQKILSVATIITTILGNIIVEGTTTTLSHDTSKLSTTTTPTSTTTTKTNTATDLPTSTSQMNIPTTLPSSTTQMNIPTTTLPTSTTQINTTTTLSTSTTQINTATTLPTSTTEMNTATTLPTSITQMNTATTLPTSTTQMNTATTLPISTTQMNTATTLPTSTTQMNSATTLPTSTTQMNTATTLPISTTQMNTATTLPTSTTQMNSATTLTISTTQMNTATTLPTSTTQMNTATTLTISTTQMNTATTLPTSTTQMNSATTLPTSTTQMNTATTLPISTTQINTATTLPTSITQMNTATTLPTTTAVTLSTNTTQGSSDVSTTNKPTTTGIPNTHIMSSSHAPTTFSTTISAPLKCLNGGQLMDGVCICEDMWAGETCAKENFCRSSNIDGFTFPVTVIGRFSYSLEICEDPINYGIPQASVQCYTSSQFGKPHVLQCTLTLEEIQQNINGTGAIVEVLAASVQILTSRPQMLTSENITAAAQIASTLLSSNPSENVALAAVTTVSQLLNASENDFTTGNPGGESTFESLTEALEKFSIGPNITTVVQPNLAVQSVRVVGDTNPGVQFSLIGDESSFVANRLELNSNTSQMTTNSTGSVQIFIRLPPGSSEGKANTTVGFVLYQNDKMFRSKIFKPQLGTSRRVISGSLKGDNKANHLEILFRPDTVPNSSLSSFACVFWNYSLHDWSTQGCSKGNDSLGNLRCLCNHTTNFAVLMSFKYDYKYANIFDWVTKLGVSLSVAGLSLTIIFQIVTRKSRKHSNATLLLVSICTALLIFYLLFIFGITNWDQSVVSLDENTIPNSDLTIEQDRGPCTAYTALMHYFLLATFTWNTIYASHMLLLLRNTFSRHSSRFTAASAVIGWGLPAVIVGVTLGVTYRVDNPLGYRQEEFCWLAALDKDSNFDMKKPMLWAFLLPVAVLLIFNTCMLAYFSYKTCRTNPNLTSTRRTSFLKKFLSSLSLAVVLSITWTLGYVLLVYENDIFSILFCIINATQGIQIFFLFTVRSTIFKKMVLSVFRMISTIEIPLNSKKVSLRRHNAKDPIESYRQLNKEETSTSVF